MIDISSKALAALKADTRYIKSHLDIYFNDVPTRLDDYFMSLDIAEDTSTSNVPFGQVIYNELTVTLDNIGKEFLLTNQGSPFFGKLVAGLKVVLTYEIEVDAALEQFEAIPGGIFYTADWTADTNGSNATLTCYDKLFKCNTEETVLFNPAKNITVKDAFVKLFKAIGLKDSEYVIQSNLTNVLPVYWPSNKKFSEELSGLAITACVNVFVDKLNIIRVQSLLNGSETDLTISDDNVIISASNDSSYSSIYDGVRITYNKVASSVIETVYDGTIKLDKGTQLITNLSLSKCPVVDIASIIIIGTNIITINSYTYTGIGLNISVTNNGEACEAHVIVKGEVLTYDSVVYTKVSKDNTRNNYLDIDLPLAQNETYIKKYAETILSIYSNYLNSLSVDIRALPIIEINDRIEVISNKAMLNNIFTVTGISCTFENGLIGAITVIISKEPAKYTYAYVGPGMVIKTERGDY